MPCAPTFGMVFFRFALSLVVLQSLVHSSVGGFLCEDSSPTKLSQLGEEFVHTFTIELPTTTSLCERLQIAAPALLFNNSRSISDHANGNIFLSVQMQYDFVPSLASQSSEPFQARYEILSSKFENGFNSLIENRIEKENELRSIAGAFLGDFMLTSERYWFFSFRCDLPDDGCSRLQGSLAVNHKLVIRGQRVNICFAMVGSRCLKNVRIRR